MSGPALPLDRSALRLIRALVRRARRKSLALLNGMRARSLVLCYHSISARDTDPHAIAVSPAHFEEHLQVLRSRYRIVSLRQMVADLRDGRVARRAVALTFDDGYSDNLYSARPLLERYDVPATVFVTTGAIGQPSAFWWEELCTVVLERHATPRSLQVKVGDRAFSWQGSGDVGTATAVEPSHWNLARSGEPPSDRQRLYAFLFDLLIELSPLERRNALAAIHESMSANRSLNGGPKHRPCTAQELLQLIDGELVQAGAHTVTHPILARLPRREQLREMVTSKGMLESMTGRRVRHFAYPYGGRSYIGRSAPELARGLGFESACSLTGRTITSASNPYILPRRPAPDVDGSRFEEWIRQQLRP